MGEKIELVVGKTDKDYAAELKLRLVEAYKPVIAVLQEATDNHFIINATVGTNGMGRIDLVALQILKGF